MSVQAPTTGQSDKRWTWGISAVAMGLGALLIVFGIVAFRWREDQGLAAMGAITSPIVSIVAAYFGIQFTAKAAEASQESAKEAQKNADIVRADQLKFMSQVAQGLGALEPEAANMFMNNVEGLGSSE